MQLLGFRNGLPLALSLCLFSPAPAQPLGRDLELAVVESTNRFRSDQGLSRLTADDILSEIARRHSQEMLEQGYLSHTSPNAMCRTITDRLRLGLRYCLSAGENLHRSEGEARPRVADEAMESWIVSPAHRKNLLSRRFNRVGVGVASKGEVYVFTQLFSYEPIIIQSLNCQPEPSGFKVQIDALVADGPEQGSLFFQGKRKLDWSCQPDRSFRAELVVPGPGLLEIGQLVAPRDWKVETEIPLPLP